MDTSQLTVTLLIVVVTGIISWRAFEDRTLFEKLKHYPYEENRDKEYYRFLSSGFVHGSGMHLAINMYVLYTFGTHIEKIFGSAFGMYGKIIFILFYLSAIVVADIPTFLKHKNNPRFASIGASGAVSAIVFVFIMYFPFHPLTFIFFPFFGIPAIILGLGYLIYSSWASQRGGSRIDHSAHFTGALYGILFIMLFQPSQIGQFISEIQSKLPF